MKAKPANPKSGWGVSRTQIGDSVKVGLAFRQHLTQQLKAGRYSSYRQAAAKERNKFW